MIENTFIKKLVAGVLRNRHTAALDKNIMHPKREWFIGISIGLVFLSAASIWSYKTYEHFSDVGVGDSGEVLEEVVYRDVLVDTALSDFEIRKKGYESLKAELLSKRKVAPEPAVVEEVAPEEVGIEPGAAEEETVPDNSVIESI